MPPSDSVNIKPTPPGLKMSLPFLAPDGLYSHCQQRLYHRLCIASLICQDLYARSLEVNITSKLLGHASVEITYNRYIDFFEEDISDTLRRAVGA